MTAPIPDLIFYGVASPSFVPSLSLYCPFSPPALLFTLLSLSAPYSSSQCRLPHCPPRVQPQKQKCQLHLHEVMLHLGHWLMPISITLANSAPVITCVAVCWEQWTETDIYNSLFFFFRALVLFSLAISYDYTEPNKSDYWDVRMWLWTFSLPSDFFKELFQF